MPTFTVHQPPPKKGEAAGVPNPERFVFVRDGFYFWAFVLAPLWLLVHRLWLALLGYLVLSGRLGGALYLVGAPSPVKFFASLLIAQLIGFEAATLSRWTLTRRGWKALGFVVAEDAEMAERRFYAEWSKRADPPPAQDSKQVPKYAAPFYRGAPSPSDVIGLFPEPGQQR
ncbi:MAG TPA: DUF2628 domain-containing protein [Pseudolabrys sp.]